VCVGACVYLCICVFVLWLLFIVTVLVVSLSRWMLRNVIIPAALGAWCCYCSYVLALLLLVFARGS
jgi:hypothetical protein